MLKQLTIILKISGHKVADNGFWLCVRDVLEVKNFN
jgi:hypothetical protein